MSECIEDEAIIELDVVSGPNTIQIGNFNFSQRECFIETGRTLSRLHCTYQIILAKSARKHRVHPQNVVRFGDTFYLKNVFSDEYLSYEEKSLMDPVIAKSTSPSKLFSFAVTEGEFLEIEQGPIYYDRQFRLCSAGNEASLKLRQPPRQGSHLYQLTLSRVDFDCVRVRRSCLQTKEITSGFPFRVFAVQQSQYLMEVNRDGKLKFVAQNEEPLILGKFYLEKDGDHYHLQSVFYNDYIDFVGRQPILSRRKSQTTKFALHKYSCDSEQDPDSTIYYLQHEATQQYFGISDGNFMLRGHSFLSNTVQLSRCSFQNISLTGFISTIVQVLNVDPQLQPNEFLKTFFSWIKGKMNRFKHSKSANELTYYSNLQAEFFTYDLVDKLVRVHTLKDSAELRREVISLITLLCRNNPNNMCRFMAYRNFIMASFYDEHFNLSIIIDMQQTMSLTEDNKKKLAIESTKLLNYLAEKGQTDDKNIKFLSFFKQVLKVVSQINGDIKQFNHVFSESRHLQHFKLPKEVTEEDLVVIEIYIYAAGLGLLPRLPIDPLVSVIKDSQQQPAFRRICLNYLFAEYLENSYDFHDPIAIEQAEQSQKNLKFGASLSGQLQSIKEYCVSQINTPAESINDNHIVALVYLFHMLCMGRLTSYELNDILNYIARLVEQFEISHEHYQKDYEFLAIVTDFLAKGQQLKLLALIQKTYGQLFRHPHQSKQILSKSLSLVLDQHIKNLEQCLSKVFYFVKLTGSNPKNSNLFHQALEVLFDFTHSISRYYEMLKKTCSVEEKYVQCKHIVVLLTGFRDKLRARNKNQQISNYLFKIKDSIDKIQDQEVKLMKAQAILRTFNFDELIFSIILNPVWFNDDKVVACCYSLLCKNADKDIVSSTSALSQLKSQFSVLDLAGENRGQYQLIYTMVKNPLLRELEYIEIIQKLVQEKQYTEKNCQHFVDILIEVTRPHRKVGIEKILRLLYKNHDTLRRVLNIRHNNGRNQFAANTAISYMIKVVQFINNLRDAASEAKEMRQILIRTLPLEIYEAFKSNGKFFLELNHQAYLQLRLQGEIIQMLCNFDLFPLMNFQVALNCILLIIQIYASCCRSFNSRYMEEAEKYFSQHIGLQKVDIVQFYAQKIVRVIKQAEDLIESNDKNLEEDKKQALSRHAKLMATQIIALFEGYLLYEQYLENQNTFNRALKILHKTFGLEPDLKFYYNYNTVKAVESTAKPEEVISQKQLTYLEKNAIEKHIIQYFFSPEFEEFKNKQKEKRMKNVSFVISNIGQGFVVQSLLFNLQDPTLIKADLIEISYQKNPKRAALALMKLLIFDQVGISKLLVENNISSTLMDSIRSQRQNTGTLMEIALKTLKNQKGELNLQAQHSFQQAFFGLYHEAFIDFIRQILIQQNIYLASKDSPKNRLERMIELRLKNKQADSGIYIKVVKFLECICQSLNFKIKDALGKESHRSKSVLTLLIQILDRTIGQILCKKEFTMSFRDCEFIQATCKAVISLLHGPHQSNIKKAFSLGYHDMCAKILAIDDSLKTLSSGTVKKQFIILSKSGVQQLKANEPILYQGIFKPEILSREASFNFELIARLKHLAMASLGIMFEQCARIQPLLVRERAQLVENNLVGLYEKIKTVYRVPDEQLIRKLYDRKQEYSILDKIVPLHLLLGEEEVQTKLDDLKPSLSLQYGIQMYNFLFKFYQLNQISSITNAVEKNSAEEKRKMKYSSKFGAIYDIYSLVKDTLSLFVSCFKRMCRKKTASDLQSWSDAKKYEKAVQFFAKNFKSIQIRLEGGVDTDVCFPLVPESRCFTTSIRNDFFRRVDFSTDYSRLESFVSNVDFTVMRLGLEYDLRNKVRKNQALGLILKYRALWKGTSFLLGFLQNLFLLLENRLDYYVITYLQDTARTLQYTSAFLLFIIFLFQSVPLRLVLGRMFIESRKYKNKFMINCIMVYYLLSDKTFVYCFLYAAITCVGTYFPIVLPLLLLDFFYRFSSTDFLKQMIFKPLKSLASNVLFLVLIIYIHVFAFIKDPNNQLSSQCKSTMACIQLEIWETLGMLGTNFINAGKIQLSLIGYLQSGIFISFTVLYRALFLGIIINQKRQFRASEEIRKQRVDYRCFVCGQRKDQIDKSGNSNKSFRRHIQMQHNLWNYISFLVYLSKLKPENMTAQQQYVVALWKKKNFDWLPYKTLSKFAEEN